jgi:transposase-like protein
MSPGPVFLCLMVADETDQHRKEPPDCPVCGASMLLVSVVPKLGGLPELQTFKCEVCGDISTHEVED